MSAAQVETPLSSASSSVTVITREDLETHQAESVADALRAVPGLTVASAGGRGAQTSVFPRGGESDYSLVFIDGVQVNSFGGGYDFAHLPAVNVERIEIVRGPQSALYGSNAIGSVIRIVTRRAGAPTASAVVEAGSFDTTRVAAATSGEVKGWNWGGSVERLGSDNANGERAANGQTVENDDYERTLVSASGGWRHGSNAGIRGDVRYTTDDRGNPGPYGSDPGGTYGGIDTIARGSNDWLQASLGANATVSRVRLTGDFTHARLDSDFASGFGDSESWSRRTTGRGLADMTIGRGLDASAGVEFLGESAGGTFITATGNVLVPVERGMAGVFGEARWNHAARLFVNAGLRVERITREALAGDTGGFPPRPPFDDDTVVSVNPKVAAAWYLTSADGNFTKVRGAAGTGIRPPDAFELAFTDNPSLQPERSRSFEAGLDQALLDGRALIETTRVLQQLRRPDRRDADVRRRQPLQHRQHLERARPRARDRRHRAGAAPLAGANLQLRLAYTFLDTEILAVDQSADAPPPYTVGDRLLRRPTHQFSADVVVDAGRLSAFLQGNGRADTRDIDPSFGAPPFGAFYDNPGFNTWALGASFRIIGGLDAFGRVTNLFDRDYEEAFGFPALGRAGMVGLRVAAGR